MTEFVKDYPLIVSSKIEKIIQETKLRVDSKFIPLETLPQGITFRWGNKHGNKKDKRFVIYRTPLVAAAGEEGEEVEQGRLKEMTDPYPGDVRKDFTTCAYTDPTLSPSLEIRNNSFFENGFELILELKSNLTPDGRPMTPEETQIELNNQMQIYGKPIQRIRDWAEEKDVLLLEKMKAAHIGGVVQGRSLTLITPPLSFLAPAELPFSLTTMSTEETKNPIIDTQKRRLVAVKLDSKSKKVAMLDEMIYTIRKHWGLRKDALFFGASALEPVIQASKAYKRVMNFDLPKAAVAGYLTKLIIKLTTTGEQKQQEAQMNTVLQNLVDEGTDIIGLNTADADVLPVNTKVDTDVLDLLAKKYEEVLMSAGGATMSQLGRTANLNRDTATIMEISHMKYVRTPDENLIAGFFENQLLNPLLKHLVGIPTDQDGNQLSDIPVRIKIVRKTKVEAKTEKAEPGEENTEINDDRVKAKKDEVESKVFKGKDVEDPSLGA